MTAQPLIPGAYERNTLTHRQSGSMGGPLAGATYLPFDASAIDHATGEDRMREGGTTRNELDRHRAGDGA